MAKMARLGFQSLTDKHSTYKEKKTTLMQNNEINQKSTSLKELLGELFMLKYAYPRYI